jgi:hypothetical protein
MLGKCFHVCGSPGSGGDKCAVRNCQASGAICSRVRIRWWRFFTCKIYIYILVSLVTRLGYELVKLYVLKGLSFLNKILGMDTILVSRVNISRKVVHFSQSGLEEDPTFASTQT